MSVQLIVYPQSFEGQYNEISSSPTEFLVNGINFANLGITPTYTSSITPTLYTYLDTLFNAPATITNSWYRFRNNNSGSPAFATSVGGNLILNTTATTSGNSISGVYQTLSNLVVGNQYTITINQSTATNGTIATQIGNGSTIYFSSFDFATSTVITNTFIAQFTESTVMIAYENNVINTATITDISVQPVVGAIPSGATNVLDNGQVIVDLYEDEDIPLSLSVDDFKNVAEQVQSYSKAFNLPATKRNNKIFDQIFEITRSYDGVIFNPYRRTQCVLKQDGFILFQGFLRMLDVTDKEGEISYNVNLYSEVLALADLLKDRTFSDLDLSELEHVYNKTNIKRSWNDSGNSIVYTNPSTSGFRDAYTTLRYPFVNWNNQMPISDGTNGTAGFPQLVTLGQAFRPFINIKYIIDRIFEETDFTYESSFFNEADFNKLYMDFNWGGDIEPNNNRAQGFGENDNTNGVTAGLNTNTKLPFDIESFSNASEIGFDITTSRFTASFDNQVYNISGTFKFSYTGYTSGQLGQFGWEKFNSLGNPTGFFPINNQLFASGNSTGTIASSFSESVILNTGESLRPSFKKFNSAVTITQLTTQQLSAFANNGATVTTGFSTTTSETLLANLRGETGQWEFLKGIITMFNLVSLPDEDNPNNIKIEPYEDIFIIPALTTPPLNWTEKIDVSQMKLTPLTDLNKKTIFKFVEDDDDAAFNQYKNQVGGHLYGSLKFDATNEFNILDGEDEIVAEPFAATVIKPLQSDFPAFITPALYSYNPDDGTSEGFENSPRIMFNNGVKSTGVSYFIPAQNGVVGSATETNFLQFSHLSDIPTSSASPSTTLDFHFGDCQLIQGVGNPTAQNLFNLYWLPYLGELYNPNTRTMTIKVNLTPADINTFKFNDTVFIKNRVFRVNKIDYKPNDLATVEFILIP